jgi:hypothetical protein
MRLVSRISAGKGRVAAVTLRLIYDGTETSTPIEVTDLQLQPGDPSGVVPHPQDVKIETGGRQYRNGVLPRSDDTVLVLANNDSAAPTTVTVRPSGVGNVRVGSYRFGTINKTATVDGGSHTATHGHGLPPMLTERSDGHVPVDTEVPVHLTIEWRERA